MTVPVLVCPVRGCGAPLADAGASLACPLGHAFDRARSGYVNLLSVLDRRAREPGDARAVVAARRALLDRGFGAALIAALEGALAAARVPGGSSALDAGAGEGTFLAALARRFELWACGLDISAHAMDAAAKRHGAHTWIVANADRHLPFGDHGFDVVLSVDGRRNEREFARVLARGGVLVVAVPAEDDLVELRAAVLAEATATDRAARVESELAREFTLVARATARARIELAPDELSALALATYRCARHAERERLRALGALAVTTSHHVLTFARRVPGGLS